MNRLLVSALALCATAASARELVVPVITGTVPGRSFSTTVQVKNPFAADVQCTFVYAGPERVGNPLRSDETIPAGKTKVYEDFLSEIAAAGTVRVTCSGDVEIVTRIQDSIDGGQTFSDGRVYRPFTITNLIARGEERTVRTSVDLVLAEMSGKAVHVEVVAKNFGGVVHGKKSYDIPPHAQRVVNLATVRDKLTEMDVTITVTTGDGKILVGKESRDPALAKVALHRTPEQRALQLASTTAAASTGPSITEQLLICPFKAAPFRDPATGLCFMRDRWYDPSTGTFLTSDPEGYRGSSNPYIYCGGDPVNCSDPTGRLGDGGDLREDFRRKERAEQERRHAIWCAQNPLECRKLDVRGRGMMRMLGGAGQTTAGAGAFLSTGPLPEPLTKTLGGTAFVRGIDNTVTGAVELWTGTPRDTMTGRAMYLALVKNGVSPSQATTITGWSEVGVDVVSTLGSSAVPALNSALRIRPVGGIINIGGTGEAGNVSNLNPVLANTGGRTTGIPNHVQAYGEQIADVFAPNSAREIMSNRLTFNTVDWSRVAQGSYTVLQPQGQLSLNIYVSGLSEAEQAALQARLINEFSRAGFRNVRVQGTGPGTFVFGTK